VVPIEACPQRAHHGIDAIVGWVFARRLPASNPLSSTNKSPGESKLSCLMTSS
jgi:hypothetical protein